MYFRLEAYGHLIGGVNDLLVGHHWGLEVLEQRARVDLAAVDEHREALCARLEHQRVEVCAAVREERLGRLHRPLRVVLAIHTCAIRKYS